MASLADCLQGRRLYKCIDIRQVVTEEIQAEVPGLENLCTSIIDLLVGSGLRLSPDSQIRNAISSVVADRYQRDRIDRACNYIFQALNRPVSIKSGVPEVLLDEARRKPYRPMQESSGPLEQILIKHENGTLRDMASVSRVVSAIDEFKLLRAYVHRDNKRAKDSVARAIKEGVNHAMAS